VSEILLFHHALGLTAGVLDIAAQFRSAGHAVHVPDLFDGRVFASIEDGVGYAEEIGFGALIERGVRIAAGLPTDLVYAGISLGVLPAQQLAQTRAGAKAALFFESCVPVSEFGDGWPAGLPVQIHGMDADPCFAGEGDIDSARALVATAGESARAELFVYPGDQHLFSDNTLPSFDAAATATMLDRVSQFLADLAENHP
jgi:dienelactone hydrolase